MAMKISQNLERVADERPDCRRARDLTRARDKANVDLRLLASLALDMLKRALDSFVNRNLAPPGNHSSRSTGGSAQ